MTQLAPNYIGSNRPLVQNMFNNPTLYAEYLLEMCWIMDQYFNNTYLDPKIDALKTLIQSHVYADNLKQYTSAQFDQNITSTSATGGPGGGNLYGLKSFVTDRYAYLQSVVDCSLGMNKSSIDNLNVYPNPFTNNITVEGIGSYEQLIILDMQGKSIPYEKIYNNESFSINLNVKPGIYFLDIIKNNESQIIKIFKN